ncbi:GPI biosynthesis protein Pig-F [Dendryphion nanum]|uniref:GPI biosynthesis protein Pig-F n=1 Tax=Dendryphion nanum TaxID=256645 RepID=A0A9P9ELP5_9PLEO|nr:GPI biosynthesis protein Pig-F [Dendryphion nanum]
MATRILEPPRSAPVAMPVDVLNNEAAKLYTHLHPVLVLSLYAFQWRAIVADPVPAMWNTLLILGVLQVVYSAICLPPTTSGGSATAAAAAEKKKIGEKKKLGPGKVEAGINQKIIPAFLSLIAAILTAIPVFVTLVLFGAPITTHLEHTALCAAHISFLGVIPLVYAQGMVGSTWYQIVALLLPIDEVYGAFIGAFIGAWLGAVPIPLDWDREWQKWPITIVTGAYIGSVAGKMIGGTILKGKTIEFDEQEVK